MHWYSEVMERVVDAATADLRRRIAAGEWAPGSQIDTFDELRRRYRLPGVSSVQNALAPLKNEGLLESRHGRGTYVSAPDPTEQGHDPVRGEHKEVLELLDQAEALIARAKARLGAEP